MRSALLSVGTVAALTLGSLSCDDPCKAPAPCTPASFGLGAAAVEALTLQTPPATCSFKPQDGAITSDAQFDDLLRCPSTTIDRSSHIDFTQKSLFVVKALGKPETKFAVRDAGGLHVGADQSLDAGCTAALIEFGVGFLVDPADNVVVHGCTAACPSCAADAP